jgi:hypothetical protein
MKTLGFLHFSAQLGPAQNGPTQNIWGPFKKGNFGGPQMKLTDQTCKTAKPKEKAYKLADGGGLYLEITPSGGKGFVTHALPELMNFCYKSG